MRVYGGVGDEGQTKAPRIQRTAGQESSGAATLRRNGAGGQGCHGSPCVDATQLVPHGLRTSLAHPLIRITSPRTAPTAGVPRTLTTTTEVTGWVITTAANAQVLLDTPAPYRGFPASPEPIENV